MVHNKIFTLIFFLCTSIGLYAQVSGIYCLAALYDGRYYVAENSIESGKKYLKYIITGIIDDKIVVPEGETNNYTWTITYNKSTATIQPAAYQYLEFTNTGSNARIYSNKYNFTYKQDGIFRLSQDESYSIAYTSDKNDRIAAYTPSDIRPACKAYPITEGYFREITVSQDGYKYGTICLPRDVAADEVKGATFYEIAGKQMNGDAIQSIVLEEVNGGLTAGKAYVFKATSDIVAAYSGTSAAEPVSKNGFCGVLADAKTISEAESGMYYGIAGNTVQKLITGASIPANRAYIDMSSVPEYNEQTSNQTKNRMVFKVQDGATSIKAETVGTTSSTYNINGVKTPTPMQGLHIINGKKILKR